MKYDFSVDWFSSNIPNFEELLGHLKDKPCRLLEIGSYEGRSTTWLLDNIATHASSLVETIDLRENPKLLHNIVASGFFLKTKFHLGRSVDILRTLPLNAYEFAYIDGNHATVNVLEDAVHCFRLLKEHGVMAFDDYLWDDPKRNSEGRPKEPVDAFLGIYSKKIRILRKGWQVWVQKLCD